MIRKAFIVLGLMASASYAAPQLFGWKGTATVVWDPVAWGRSVSYKVGYSQYTNTPYTEVGPTSGTNWQVKGLKYNTYYYFSVKTTDSDGLESPWSPSQKYLVVK